MTLAAGQRLGPYEVLAPIGAGGMGEVYRAKDTRLDRTVAIKVLPSQFSADADRRERFEREARAVSSLNHPHICALYDVGEQDGTVFLVMEHLEGQTLAERLEKGSLPTDQVLRYGTEIADALDKAHRQGIVHRDLKPGNIMLTKAGAKLLDFGLAKLNWIEGAPADVSKLATREKPLTGDGTMLGTFQYMAPEQLEGKPADVRTDLFALGSLLYEMATGHRAFEAKSQASLIVAILEHEPPPMTTLQPLTPQALERLVKVCLAKDPDDRLQTAHDVMQELKWIAEAVPQAATATARQRRASPERLAWLLALLLGGAAMFFVGSSNHAPAARAPMRFAILPEKGTELDGTIALSPDGRRLAFTAADAKGQPRLWVRPLDAFTAQPLAGTEGASFPFWSPDGRYLGFFAQGQLRRIEATGGPTQTLCEAGQGRGGTWNRDGVILFSASLRSLTRVNATGGVPTSVTTLDPARGEGAHRWPHFLPDGHHFLFLIFGGRKETRGIYLGSLDSKETRRLLPDCSMATFVPSGDLLFVRDGTLMAQALDPESFELRGEPFSVAAPVWSDLSTMSGLTTLSAAGNDVLAYRGGGPARTRLVWFDRGGRQIGELGTPADYSAVSLSPDGRTVAASRGDSQGVDQIWLFDLGRGLASRFTLGAADQYNAVWSPDSSELFFPSNADGAPRIYRQPLTGAGGAQRVLASKGASDSSYPLSLSPDGRSLLFQNLGQTGNDIFLLPLFGDARLVPVLQGPFDERSARFSADGRWIAYVSNESGQDEVYVQAFPAASGKWQISTAGGGQPQWRRDGRELFYASPDGRIMAADVRPGLSRFEAGTPHALFVARSWANVLASEDQYAVTGDGQRFLVVLPVPEPAAGVINVVLNWSAGLKR
jgi:Tol biopolymer transport system component